MLSINPKAISAGNQKALLRAIHACARLEASKNASVKGKGKASSDSLFAPSTKSSALRSNTPSTSVNSSTSTPIPTSTKSTLLSHQSSSTNTRGWQEFERSWPYESSPSPASSSKSSEKTGNANGGGEEESRTIFEKPLSFNPLFRLLGAGFTAFIGFQWFWIPQTEDYDTFWKSRPGTGFGTQLWGTAKNIVFWQTPYWALGGAAISIYSLTKKLNIVTKLEQCRIRPSSPGGSEEIYIRMSTVKQALLRGLSKEPRKLKLGDIQMIPVKGSHENHGEVILNLSVKDSIKSRFFDGQPYIVDTRYAKYLDKSDKPYVLSPSRLRHVFGRLDGQ